MRGRGCSVSTSFHMGLNDADHSWQLTQPTCRASSILKITQSPLSVHQPPAVSGLSKNKFILQSLSFSFVLFQQRQVTQTHTNTTFHSLGQGTGVPGASHSMVTLPAPPSFPFPLLLGSKTLSSPFFLPFHVPLTLTGSAMQVLGSKS